MSKTCPLPTPAERQYGDIQSKLEKAMMQKVYAALRDAADQAHSQMQAAGLEMPPPSRGYFAAIIHQAMYCTLCEANPETFAGGRADIAVTIIRNCQNIARHYWGADIEPDPRPRPPSGRPIP